MAADEPSKTTRNAQVRADQASVQSVAWGESAPRPESPSPERARATTAPMKWSAKAQAGPVLTWAFEQRAPVIVPPQRPKPAAQVPDPRQHEGESAEPSQPEADEGEPESLHDEFPDPSVPEGMMLVSEEALAEREEAIVEALRTPYLEAARKLLQAAEELETRLRDDVVELAARIGQALVYRELKTDRGVILEVAQRALRLVGPLERLTVRCASEDAELLRENLPGLARAEVGRVVEVLVRPSDDIMPGGLLLTFEGGVVDAREERRLARIAEAVKTALRDVEHGGPSGPHLAPTRGTPSGDPSGREDLP